MRLTDYEGNADAQWAPAAGASSELRVKSLPPAPGTPQALPIDLPTALRLGNANNLEIAYARERLNAAAARMDAAQALVLPSLSVGTAYMSHDGQTQRAIGEVFYTRRSSLFLGGGPTLAVDVADAVYEPLVAHQLFHADDAAANAAENDTLLRVAEAYCDLLSAQANVAIAQETRTNAGELARLTEEFRKQDAGLPSDAARAQAELGLREQQAVLSEEKVVIASATLAQGLRLDPQVQLVPLEATVTPVELITGDEPLASLVEQALVSRPELVEQQALVQASVARLRQATYGPLIPSVLLGYQAGGFGGGFNEFFGDFAGRQDLTAAAVWELRNLGFGDCAQRRVRASQLTQAQIRALQVADRVAAEVVTAHQVVASRGRQVQIARHTVEAAIKSHDLNVARIRGGAGLPIEVLQSIQAQDRAKLDYLQAVVSYNKAQFRLLTALGSVPVAPAEELPPPHADKES